MFSCKSLRRCYQDMLNDLLDMDEVPCVEDAAIGLSTLTVFLKALKQYCYDVFDVLGDHMTFEGRTLYEVHLAHGAPPSNIPKGERTDEPKPIFIIEAGQEGGSESVMMALFIIEQLVACEEYDHMLRNVRWVILPCTNPDGQEYSRYSKIPWKKNLKPSQDDASFGVDLTRNFESQWGACPKVDWGFSQIYPGPQAASENETMFIKNVLSKHKKDAQVYLSIKRDGHSINYPYAYTRSQTQNHNYLNKVAADVSARVNQRTASVHLFTNSSIFEAEGKAHCGHSVDYAYDLGIPLTFEMRVFLGSESLIMSKFQSMPRGYETSLRNGYFVGIREIYNQIVHEKKYI
ncbi:unnamed protein product [Arctia plantaginis]|uniref:Peptidase M14 domain-containing protein n=1 Tax=Arctia plantaginis TaxID=874455 RepID=A0A8S0ZD82_ARCPL|nr:unnamed protein product [Arctia plantaginis]CAB3257023.1 unnamed protein product [Arctia plantaginis]